jgi:hypothetical protein
MPREAGPHKRRLVQLTQDPSVALYMDGVYIEYPLGNIRQESFDSLGLMGLATFGDPRSYGLTLEYNYF